MNEKSLIANRWSKVGLAIIPGTVALVIYRAVRPAIDVGAEGVTMA